MADIIIAEFMDKGAVASLQKDFDVLYDEGLVDKPAELAGLVAGCRALVVRNRTQVRGDLLAGAAKLQVVGRLGVGLDNIDVPACKAKGVSVIPATGANDVAVAEYVLTGLLMLARGCYGDSAAVLAGEWPRSRQIGGEIYGKTLGLIGFGGIAREVALRATVFGMRVVAYDPFLAASDACWEKYGVTPLGLDALLEQADAVSLHVPLVPETKHLIHAGNIAKMRDGALLVNSSRGGTVDEEALVAALRSGKIGGALLDVYEKEPLPAGSVLVGAPNCIVTAHIAGVTRESNVRVSYLIAEKVKAALLEAQS